MTSSAGHRGVSYKEITEDGYGDAFARDARATPTRRGVRVDGDCPRCAGQMSYPLVDKVFRSPSPLGTQVPTTDPNVVAILCTCPEDHPDQPDGEKGCGAYWNITLSAT
ncbi:hypothetical protein [Streptomyces sp. WAC 05379]|uniref:hypothetical protein n=1 Tax=Streptomyces sp. WAC 05379 TaxID=2203207 RepID=UPI000F73A07E|nr:hypothetical protein [Streptomyces sp. WAC 05379]